MRHVIVNPAHSKVPAREPTELLLFDVGNTLLLLDHDLIATAIGSTVGADVLRRAERTVRRDLNAALTARLSGTRNVHALRVVLMPLLMAAGVSDVERAFATLERINDRQSLWRRVNPDAVRIIDRLRQRGIRMGIVSNADGHLDDLLQTMGLHHLFEVVVDSAVVGVAKPDPEIFRHAARAVKVRPDRTAYVGDLPALDVVGSALAGMRPVLYDWDGVFHEEIVRLSAELNTTITSIRRMDELLECV